MEKPITLTNEIPAKMEKVDKKSSGLGNGLGSVLLFVFKAAFMLALIVTASFYISNTALRIKEYGLKKYQEARKDIFDKLEIVDAAHAQQQPRTSNSNDEPDRKELIAKYSAKYGVSPVITSVIIDHESGGRSDRFRYEDSWRRQYGSKFPKTPGMNDIEYSMNFVSAGLLQVGFPVHKEFCNLNSFTDLFDDATNLDCGLKIFSRCLSENADVRPKGKRLRLCFRQYNGSGPAAEQYASTLMGSLADHLLDDGVDPSSVVPETQKMTMNQDSSNRKSY